MDQEHRVLLSDLIIVYCFYIVYGKYILQDEKHRCITLLHHRVAERILLIPS